MGSAIFKAAKDVDLYCEWSSIVEAPTKIGTRAEMRCAGVHEERLVRADKHGTSALGFFARGDYPPSELDGAWEDTGMIVEQRGWLPRVKLAGFLMAYADDPGRAYRLLEPFEGMGQADG